MHVSATDLHLSTAARGPYVEVNLHPVCASVSHSLCNPGQPASAQSRFSTASHVQTFQWACKLHDYSGVVPGKLRRHHHVYHGLQQLRPVRQPLHIWRELHRRFLLLLCGFREVHGPVQELRRLHERLAELRTLRKHLLGWRTMHRRVLPQTLESQPPACNRALKSGRPFLVPAHVSSGINRIIISQQIRNLKL